VVDVLFGSSKDEVNEDANERRIEAKFDGEIGEFGICHSWIWDVRTIDVKAEYWGEIHLEGQQQRQR
jgi:hypothetical protein